MAYNRRGLTVSVLTLALASAGLKCGDSTSPLVCGGMAAAVQASVVPTAAPWSGGGFYRGCQDNAFVVNAGLSNASLSVASSGNNGRNEMELNFGAPGMVDTVTVGIGVALSFQVDIGGAIWNATQGQGSGTLAVTSITATSATGTFSFTATPTSGGATGNVQVTDGTFSVTF